MEASDTERVYRYLKDYIKRVGIPPSYREVARNCHLSIGNVVRQMDRLEAEGRIIRLPGKARGIILLD